MNFWEKLDKLTAKQGKGAASKKAELPITAISNYISKRQLPRADAARKIARALNVSLDWLLDDTAEFPEPNPLEKISDRSLMIEVAARHRKSLVRLLAALDRAEKEDWSTAASRIPQKELLEIAFPVRYAGEMMARFRPDVVARVHHSTMPGNDRPESDFDSAAIKDRVLKVFADANFVAVCQVLIEEVPDGAVEEIERDLLFGVPLVAAGDDSGKKRKPRAPGPPPRRKLN